MSLLSDVLGGNIGNALHDLNPSNILSDAGPDLGKALSNPLLDVGLAASLAAPILLPGLLGGDALLGGAAAASSLDPTALAAGVDLSAADAALPTAAVLDSGTLPAGIVDEFNTAFPAAASGGLDPGALSAGAALPGAGGVTALGVPTTATLGDATAAAGDGGILSQITGALAPVSGALKTAAPILGLGGLGYNLYQGYQTNQANKALTAQEATKAQTAANIASADQAAAAPLLTSGQTLTQYLATGTLPPDFQAQVKQQVDAAKASIIQGYGARGQSTNPQENSALAEDLANVDIQAQSLSANLESTLNTAGTQLISTANALLTSGLSATRLSAELPIQISQLNSALNKQMSDSLANFTAALNGSVPNKNSIQLSLPSNIINSQGVASA